MSYNKTINKGIHFTELESKFKHKAGKFKNYAYFYNSNKSIFSAVIDNIESIINNKCINFKEIISDNEKFENFRSKNSSVISEDGWLTDSNILNDIVDLCKNILFNNNKLSDEREVSNFFTLDFDNCSLVDDDLLLPEKEFDKTSMFYALFKNKNVKFKFNPKISNIDSANMYISTRKFLLQSQIIRQVDIPTKYRITCKEKVIPKKNDNIVKPFICNKLVYCSPVDGLHNNVKCELGHIIKDINKATPEEVRTFYIYRAKDITEGGADEEDNLNDERHIEVFSLEPLEDDEFICNAVPTYNTGENKMNYFIINYKPIVNKVKLKNPILLKENSHFFLDDIFNSIKKYYYDYHKQKVTNQNKIVGLTMILQFLCQRYIQTLYPGLATGKTGSGKSYFFLLLNDILLDNSIGVQPTIRRNKFIGGQDNVSIFGSRLFLPGYVQTKNFIFIEEMAEKIEEYVNNKNNKNYDIDGNLFNMHKQCYDGNEKKQINIGIQGDQPIMVNAVPFSVGNSTSLKSNKKKYYSKLKNYYSSVAGKPPSHKYPLFKPLQYYKYIIQDEDLMNAHKKVRSEYDTFFMTGLDHAEQSRFVFFYMIDDLDKGFERDDTSEIRRRNKIGRIRKQVHKKELLKELDDIFSPLKKLTAEQSNFLDIVNDYVDRLLDENPRQFGFDNGEIPTHIKSNIAKMNGDLLLLHKTYYNLPLELTQDDKDLLDYFNNFNYRLLSIKEASMVVKPIFNDGEVDIDEVENKHYIEELKKIEDEKEKKKLEVVMEENELFDNLPEDEFSD